MQPANRFRQWANRKLRTEQAQIVTIARADHHAMFAESDRISVTVNCCVSNRH
jgi:hypothetical protein